MHVCMHNTAQQVCEVVMYALLSAPHATEHRCMAAHEHVTYFVLYLANRECLSDSSLMDLRMSACIMPADEKTRSKPADDGRRC